LTRFLAWAEETIVEWLGDRDFGLAQA
jgi:hypothetical protein